MHTLFLFFKHFDGETCFCLLLDENRRVVAPSERRTIEEIKNLQSNAKTIIVLPASSANLHQVTLPSLREAKARAAIPYALEDEIADPVDNLHFAFDKEYYQNNTYLVVVIDKDLMQSHIDLLTSLKIDFDLMTLDWFALKDHESFVVEDDLLINDTAFRGSLSIDLLTNYLKVKEIETPILIFNDSVPMINEASFTKIDSRSYIFLAERLLEHKAINLCQGEFQNDKKQMAVRRWHWALLGLAVASFLVFILTNACEIWFLSRHIDKIDRNIAVIYHEFFPHAEVIISPKFRIEQLLKNKETNLRAPFWNLLSKLSHAVAKVDKAMPKSSLIISELKFQNNILTVTLACRDFSSLEGFQKILQQEELSVHQINAATHNDKVVATLELAS